MSGQSHHDESRLEVQELTDLLRNDDSFADTRQLLISKGLSGDEVILAGLIEGEDESRYGVVITSGADCICFETDRYGAIRRWEFVEDPADLISDFGAVSVAIDMQRNGGI
jgi:hypothetical protein